LKQHSVIRAVAALDRFTEMVEMAEMHLLPLVPAAVVVEWAAMEVLHPLPRLVVVVVALDLQIPLEGRLTEILVVAVVELHLRDNPTPVVPQVATEALD
jgi:hypothetical protein